MTASNVLYLASIWVLPILLAITLHEAAHGYVAWKLGDDTAYLRGRVSFNPLRHVDMVGTVLLPALLILIRAPLLFGYAKPVPVNFGRLRKPRRDMVWVAAAGPATNLALAVVSAALLQFVDLFPPEVGRWLALNLFNSLRINVLLAIFNMLPIPPLDGGRVAVGLLPNVLAFPLARLERVGIVLVLAIILLPRLLGDAVGADLDVFHWLIGEPTRYVMDLILTFTGIK